MVVAVRAGASDALKALARIVDATPVLTREQLDLADWISGESLSRISTGVFAPLAGKMKLPSPSRAGPAPMPPPRMSTVWKGSLLERRP